MPELIQDSRLCDALTAYGTSYRYGLGVGILEELDNTTGQARSAQNWYVILDDSGVKRLMEGWYVAKIQVQKELALMTYLSQCGVDTFYPKIVQRDRNGGTLRAMFPTYLFCHLDPGSSIWPMVRWAPGLTYFLTSDGEPARLPQALIDYLRQQVSERNDPDSSRNLANGDRVLVSGGPFAGLQGIFQRYMSSRQRCRILLEMVGRLTAVELPEWEVKEASSTLVEC